MYTISVWASPNCEKLVTNAIGSASAQMTNLHNQIWEMMNATGNLRGRPGESPTHFSQRRYNGVDQLMLKNSQDQFVDQSFIARLNRMNPGFEALIFDEGLIFRIDEFEAWWTSEGHQGLTPWQARQAFSNHLGTRIVYRALQLSETDLTDIMKHGLFPKNVPASTAGANFQSNPMNIETEVLHHLSRTNANSLVQSVSTIPEVALAAAKGASLGGNVVLFTLEISEIDLLHISSSHKVLNVSRSHDFREMFRNDLHITQPNSAVTTAYKYDQNVEAFIFKPILPDQIKSWQKMDWSTCPDLKWIKHHREE